MKITDKSKFNQIFKELRSEGYIALQNRRGGQSTAWRDIRERGHEINDYSKVLFYNTIDGRAFDKDKQLTDKIFLSWKGNGTQIANKFKKNGFDVDWNGKKSTRIGVSPKD